MNNVNNLKEWSYDSSLSDTLKLLSDNEYKEKLVSLLQPILEQQFPKNSAKQKIYVHRERINFSCVYCSDSMKSDYKKRGNIILTGRFTNYFKCFNCGTFKRIDNFFEDFKINLDLNIVDHISKSIKDFSVHSNVKYDMSLFLDMKSIDNYAIDRQGFLKHFGLKEVKESPVWSWLTTRLQYDASKFMYNPKSDHIIILNLTQTGKILGAQKRLFKGENKYLTDTLIKIYTDMGKNPKEIPDEINMLSQLFNICLVDYSKSIILLEGPLDSFLIHNSIANAGANKSFPIDIHVKYLYDKDKTGIKKSIEHINDGEEVFLWDKFLKDVNAPYREKWDITDISIWAKENNVKLPNILNYFSKGPLDIVDI
jgi:hypothetical protein